MLLIRCPYCGERPEIEFRYAGQAHIERTRAPDQLDDQTWAGFLYQRTNPRGVHAERWRHVFGCARFFNCIRNTESDEILATYRTGAPPPEAGDLGVGDGL